MERNIDEFLVVVVTGIGLVTISSLISWAIWGKDMPLECDVEVDGKVYECSTAPKISSAKVIKFYNGKRYVEIPIDKEVIITFGK